MPHIVVDQVRTRERDPSYAYWNVRPAQSLVVFVHGWGGHCTDTWKPAAGYIAAHDGAGAGHDLLFYAYDSRNQPAGVSAAQLARYLLDFLADPTAAINASAKFGLRRQATAYQSVIFLCHSLGAVVTRQALLDLAARSNAPPAWLNRVRLALFAPAHKGALATEVGNTLLSELLGAPGRAIGAALRLKWQSLLDLEQGSSFLATLEQDSRAYLQHNPGAGCARAAVVAWASNDLIVVRQNFALDVPAEVVNGTDHVSICKPAQREHDAYALMTALL
ncbi:esterase/lipase family protein [Lysobacter silvisoli]|uniref:AB hydrolase-1 domain-containing protein n=1 Tax=Lysobacter silvisoli TaxID=2293254 RepID=A0A371K4T9_9GAMM|nr:alpha/beta fold hydrolase [Lysobacter silvisoli]RDZ28892.1 hypothetical protein DX914_07240 [Lysobacter silvisoli]